MMYNEQKTKKKLTKAETRSLMCGILKFVIRVKILNVFITVVVP